MNTQKTAVNEDLSLKQILAAEGYTCARVYDPAGQFVGMRVLNAYGEQMHKGKTLSYEGAQRFLDLLNQARDLLRQYYRADRIDLAGGVTGKAEWRVVDLMAGIKTGICHHDSKSGDAVSFVLDEAGRKILV